MKTIRLEPQQIVPEVVKLLVVNQIQEIAIWCYDTDVRFLDGTTANYNWGCHPYRMKELTEELRKIKCDI